MTPRRPATGWNDASPATLGRTGVLDVVTAGDQLTDIADREILEADGTTVDDNEETGHVIEAVTVGHRQRDYYVVLRCRDKPGFSASDSTYTAAIRLQ